MTTLRQAVGRLRQEALAFQRMDASAARWIASDVLRELKSDAVQRRLTKD